LILDLSSKTILFLKNRMRDSSAKPYVLRKSVLAWRLCRLSVLGNVGECKPDGGRESFIQTGDAAFQGLVTNTGAFLDCHVVWSRE
jgi:hypothetical protein